MINNLKECSTFGETLKSKRLQCGMTQKDVAESVSSTVAAISQFEHDKHLPKIDMIYSLAEVLSVPIEMLMFSGNGIIHDINLSDEFLKSDKTFKIFGYTPDRISITDIAEHKYRSMKIWNPDYKIEQFLTDIVYPYVSRNPQEVHNLLKAYGHMDSEIDNADVAIDKNEMILSKTIRKNIYESKNDTMVFAGSNSNIYDRMIVPNILNMDADFVIMDTNGMLYGKTADKLMEKGYDVEVLNLTGHPLPFNTEKEVGYNVVSNLSGKSDIADFVDNILLAFVNNNDAYNALHIELMRNYLEGCVQLMVNHYETKAWTIGTLLKVLSKVDSKEAGYKTMDIIPHDLYLDVVAVLQSFNRKVDIKNIFDMDKFFTKSKKALFIHVDTCHPHVNAMSKIFLQKLMRREFGIYSTRKTVYVIDEIENIGKMFWLPGHMVLNHDSIFMCVCHSVDGLMRSYGKDIGSMVLSACSNIVYTQTHDVKTCDYMAMLAGDNVTFNHGRMRSIPTLCSRQIASINKDECIVLCHGSKAIIDKMYE